MEIHRKCLKIGSEKKIKIKLEIVEYIHVNNVESRLLRSDHSWKEKDNERRLTTPWA